MQYETTRSSEPHTRPRPQPPPNRAATYLRESLGLVDHTLDLLVREPVLVVGDGDGLRLAARLPLSDPTP